MNPTTPVSTPESNTTLVGMAAPAVQTASARRDQVLYVRVTTEEKEKIVERARQSRLSVSRFLTQLALDGKAPPTVEERRRLEDLLTLFKRTETGLRHLGATAEEYRLFSSIPGVEDDFALAEQSISGLIRELAKRV